MRYVKAVASIAACMTMVATAVVGVVAPAEAAAISYKLSVSTHPSRSHPVSVNGAKLQGKVYIFATPASSRPPKALRVHFYVDGHLVRTETTAPYDLMGGSRKQPRAYDTRKLVNGSHTLHISVDEQNKQHFSATAHFTVNNPPPKPYGVKVAAGAGTVTVTWRGGAGAARFYIYRGTSSRVTIRHPIAAVRGGLHTYTDTSVKSGHRYYYVVQVVTKAHGRSNSKAVRSAKVKPSNLAVVTAKAAGGDGKVTVAWSNHGTADHVRIYRTTSATFPSTPSITFKAPIKKSWTDTSVTDGTLYRYKVELAQGVHKAHSAALTATPIAAPAGVSLTGVSNGITVSWTGGGAGVTSYAIYRSTSAPVPLTTPLNTVGASTSTWTDTTTTPGTTYSYAVLARGLHGQAQTTVTATPAGAPVLNLPASTHNSVTLNWTPPASGAGSVTEYDVFRGTSGADAITHAAVHTQAASDHNWVDTTVTDDTLYFYVVRAVSNGGTADSGAQQATPLGAPSNLQVSLDGSNKPVLTWDVDSNSPATRYRIFGGTSSSVSTATELNHVLKPTATYTDASTTLGNTYYYVVQAWYSDGTGSGSTNSTTVSISTPQNAATNVDAALDVDGVHVSWLGVDDSATSVEVYRSDSDQSLGDLISGPLPQSANEYTDTDTLTPGGTVFYTVRVIGPGGHTDAAPVEYDVPV